MQFLQMTAIGKKYSGVPALVDASLTLEPAQIMALVGQNGAGKSTLIKILTGATHCDQGTISLDGKQVRFSNPNDAQAAGIQTIYQELTLAPHCSVAENIVLGHEARKYGLIDWRSNYRRAEEILSEFEISIDVKQPLGHFNAATRQMVAIARAVSRNARLVIMDEATSSLDAREVEKLFRTIKRLKENGVAVLFVNHRLDELYAICDAVTIMRDGCTVGTAAMKDISKIDLVKQMVGKNLQKIEKSPRQNQRDASLPPMISAKNLSAPPVMNDISIDIYSGEIVALAGLLGSGRSETARAIFAANPIKSGEIIVKGKRQNWRSPKDAIQAGLGFCGEDRKTDGIIPEMSVAENLTLTLLPQLSRFGIVNLADQLKIVAKYIDLLGIKLASPHQRIRDLSGGNQQKVLLARWLAMNSAILILDEPTRGIDVGGKVDIVLTIRNLVEQGLAVLMVSSEIEEIMSLADHVTILSDGVSVAHLSGDDISENSILAEMAHDNEANHSNSVDQARLTQGSLSQQSIVA